MQDNRRLFEINRGLETNIRYPETTVLGIDENGDIYQSRISPEAAFFTNGRHNLSVNVSLPWQLEKGLF